MWTERNDHAPKCECADFFFIYVQKSAILKRKKIKFDHTLDFSCLHFSSLPLSSCFHLELQQTWLHGGEEEKTYFVVRIIHVFVHACEACCGHLSIDFARRIGNVFNLELSL